MFRVSVLYGPPEDTEAFERYYREVHIPIAAKMRGLTGWSLTWVRQQTGDVEDPVHLIADLYADDEASMDEIFASPEGQEAAADVPRFATGGVTYLRGEVEDVLPR